MSAHPKGHARTALLIFVLAVCSILFSFSTHGVGRVQRGVKPASLAAHRLFARAPAGLERSVPHSLLRGIHRVAFKPSQGTPFSFSSRSRVQSEITTKSIVERAEEIANAIEIQDLESNNRRMLSTLSDEALEGKVVLLRADLNVPLAEDSEEVVDDQRIKDSIPTIQYLMKKGAKVLIIGHIERVSKTGEVKEVSMAPVAAKMSELLNEVVTFVSDCTGDRVKTVSQSMGEGSVALLENIRLGDSGKRDLENDPEFARELAGLADVYVLDDFSDSHLKLASTVGAAEISTLSVGGYVIEKEMEYLVKKIEKPRRPFAAIVGGARLSEKYELINRLLDKVDGIFIGGAIANTFLMALGYKLGDSLNEPEQYKNARRLELKARNRGIKIMYPEDFVFADGYEKGSLTTCIPFTSVEEPGHVPSGWMNLDAGESSMLYCISTIKSAETVFWNGPVGAEEVEKFAYGTHALAASLAGLADCNKTVIVAGRDTVAALDKINLRQDMTHVSTGAASFLDLMEGKILPGLNALDPPLEVEVEIPDVNEEKPIFDID